MPKTPLHTLTWSQDHARYELSTQGQLVQLFPPEDTDTWQSWLATATAFTFRGAAGRLNVYQEARGDAGHYWYAYHTTGKHTRKRYLGQLARVTFARLEEIASALDQGESGQDTTKPSAMPLPLLSTSLVRPLLRSDLVVRERLLTRLDAAYSYRLTLVSASAGWGKTTLLSMWSARSRFPVAWLSLDELDNDPIRFWASCIAALRTCLPTVGKVALELLHNPQAPAISTVLITLINEILEHAGELLLLLDDYHVIEDQTIHEALAFLLDHLPANLHLIVASRTDPDLPLARWRTRDQMLELRDPDLSFTPEEASIFLTKALELPFSAEEVSQLQRRTEGWIAGLQLAALALRRYEDRAAFLRTFTGSHRYLMDYVQQEILKQQPLPLQQFLLHVAVLPRMNAELCQAVTGEPASQEFLEELERNNLFLVPLDAEQRWYRLHDLFREALLARLRASQSELVPLLHIRAASFYEAAGELREAIAHALAAPDYSFAASLMEQAAESFWAYGEVRTVYTWVFSLPDPVLRAHLGLALGAALRFVDSVHMGNETLFASTAAQVESTFARMEGFLCNQMHLALSEAEEALIRQRLLLLHALIEARTALKRGEIERLRHLSQEIDMLPQDTEVGCNMILLTLTFWLTAVFLGEGASLIARLLSAKQQILEAGDPQETIRVLGRLAFAYTQAAQLRQAQRECLEGLALVKQIGERTIWSGYLYNSLFIVSYARNRLEEAADWLKLLRQSAQEWQLMELLVMGEVFSARIGLARGDLPAAHQALHQLEALLRQGVFAHHTPWVIILRVQLWLAEGNLAEAWAWAAQTTFSPQTWNPLRRWEVLMLVRVSLAQQQYTQAVETLECFREHLDRPEDIQTTIEFLVLSVIALYHSGQRVQAVHLASRLLEMTEPEGYTRLFLDLGEPLMKQVLLLWLAAPQDQAPSVAIPISRFSASRLLATFEQEEPSALSAGAPQARKQESQPQLQHAQGQRGNAELLSPQELKVLRLLVAGRSNPEIASDLVVSVNTVKTQIQHIYRKLGITNRMAASAAARNLHLL
jgi:LuxR family maltose regulon positive regulatory protein